jgi:cytochrome c peroxidase
VGTAASQRNAQISQRGLTTVPSPASGIYSKWTLLIAAGLAVGGAGAFLLTKQNDSENSKKIFLPSKDDYQKVYNEIARLLIVMDEYDDGSYGPVSLSRISDLDMIR